MKVTASYYLNYPNDRPKDPEYAYTEMYVEYGNEDDSIDSFQGTIKAHVYTIAYAMKIISTEGSLMGVNILIVKSIADSWMNPFLDANITKMVELYGSSD